MSSMGKLELLLCTLTSITFLPLALHRSSCKCIDVRELSMKKSVRPAASKVSGERGKAEATSSTGTGKPATKSGATVPLPKVRHHLITRTEMDLLVVSA